MSTLIRQSVTFRATPHAVYEALMDSRKHARFTQSPAKISRKVGGAISAFGDYITGRNLELMPDEKIVQAWHGADWPDGQVVPAAEVAVIVEEAPPEAGDAVVGFDLQVQEDEPFFRATGLRRFDAGQQADAADQVEGAAFALWRIGEHLLRQPVHGGQVKACRPGREEERQELAEELDQQRLETLVVVRRFGRGHGVLSRQCVGDQSWRRASRKPTK